VPINHHQKDPHRALRLKEQIQKNIKKFRTERKHMPCFKGCALGRDERASVARVQPCKRGRTVRERLFFIGCLLQNYSKEAASLAENTNFTEKAVARKNG